MAAQELGTLIELIAHRGGEIAHRGGEGGPAALFDDLVGAEPGHRAGLVVLDAIARGQRMKLAPLAASPPPA